MSVGTISKNINNVIMLESLKNLDFLLYRLDGVGISLEEFFSQQFQSNLLTVFQRFSQVDLGGVAFSEGGKDFIFVVEYWVLLLVHCTCVRLDSKKLNYNLFPNHNIFISILSFELPRKI